MLSVIVGSLDRALSYAVTKTGTTKHSHNSVVPSKVTLIVVPSARKLIAQSHYTITAEKSTVLIENWMEQIQMLVMCIVHILPKSTNCYIRHVTPGTLRVYTYHNMQKNVDILTLLKQDIVFTTYATINTEFSRGIPRLDKIEWYRILLDEGKPSCGHQRCVKFYLEA